MPCGLSNPGKPFVCVWVSVLSSIWWHLSLKNLWDSVCVAFYKNACSFPKVRKYSWDSQSVFPSKGPIMVNGERTSWWPWVFPKSAVPMSISGWAPGRQELLAGGFLQVSFWIPAVCAPGYAFNSLTMPTLSIPSRHLSLWITEDTTVFSMLPKSMIWVPATSVSTGYLLNVESWPLTYTSWIRI